MPLRRAQPTLTSKRLQRRNQLYAFASLLLVDAQDDSDRCLAVALLKLGKDATYSDRYGPRGPYNAAQSMDIFRLMMNEFSDRRFRSWLR
jgi:hypothetical protein